VSQTRVIHPGVPKKLVIAHRGASGYLPENTLPAYAMAYAMGADYIEPDLVMTRDGVLICVHDICLEATTDAAAVFPNRARGDGRWYAADFDVKEIRLLQARERFDFRNMLYLPDFEQNFCTTFKKGRVLPRGKKTSSPKCAA
jgi:glycerophosphoryl diester phosphodiesterase